MLVTGLEHLPWEENLGNLFSLETLGGAPVTLGHFVA